MIVTSYGHVLSTSFFDFDRGFVDLVRKNRRVFLLWPAVVIAVSAAAYALGPTAYRFMFSAFFAWNLWHFQRQNYGVIAFAASARRVGPMPRTLNAMLNLATASGICAVLARPEMLALPFLWWVALVPLVASTVLLAHILLTEKRFGAEKLPVTFAVIGWAFFIPTLLSPDPVVSLSSYGVAHGLQYLIFMSILARGSSLGTAGPAVLVLVTGIFLIGVGLLAKTPAGPAIYTGIVMAHFVIDAKVWKMREPMQRALIRSRFGFVFG